MKFKSALVTQASGSLGGMTFSRNRYGMYTRAKGLPVNPNSEFQQAVRQIFSGLAAAWNGELDAGERAAWEDYAANMVWSDSLGEPIKLSGQSVYAQLNTPRLQAGLARIDAAPEIFTQPTYTAPTVTADESDGKLHVAYTNTDDWAGEVGGALLLYASRPLSPSIKFFKGPYRYAGKVAGAVVPPTSPADITMPFAIAGGQQVGIQYRIVRADGRMSAPFRELLICAE